MDQSGEDGNLRMGAGKKVRIFSLYFAPEKGAGPTRISNMAHGLQEAGFDVEVITAMPNYPTGRVFPEYAGRFYLSEVHNEIKVRRLWLLPTTSRSAIIRLISMLSSCFSLICMVPILMRTKADISIVQCPPLLVSWTAILISKYLLRANTVLNVSDLWPQTALDMGAIRPGLMYRLLEKIEHVNYQLSDKFIVTANEIINHIKIYENRRPFCLYRNIPARMDCSARRPKPHWHGGRPRIIYAGLLGYAQGMAEIVAGVDWDGIGVELSIFGDGAERGRIESYLEKHPTKWVQYRGVVLPSELDRTIHTYHAALVPLVKRIRGAVPSKLFELSHQGMPVIFSAGGEGADIVTENHLGWVSDPGDLEGLLYNLENLKDISESAYTQLVANCQELARTKFSFQKQLRKLIKMLLH
ncbi:glycosyltransferase family 4 protein [bacterium]|nr:glycosyltransferase family 4 protein [bacterium]